VRGVPLPVANTGSARRPQASTWTADTRMPDRGLIGDRSVVRRGGDRQVATPAEAYTVAPPLGGRRTGSRVSARRGPVCNPARDAGSAGAAGRSLGRCGPHKTRPPRVPVVVAGEMGRRGERLRALRQLPNVVEDRQQVDVGEGEAIGNEKAARAYHLVE
jgi:hypothetical protein